MTVEPQPGPGVLAGIRVIDLATRRAELAGRLLADLGAEVLKIEPPAGAEARHLPPFAPGGRSLYWAAAGLGKQSAVLDYEKSPTDRERLRSLAEEADILIESFDPGVMSGWGLGYGHLRESNPGLIYVSVTPYGQEGPWAARPATELTVEAAAGLVGLQGDGDRPPVPVGFPQAWFHAGAQAAADAMIALCERERSGLGQHLDVSAQAAVVGTLMNATGYPPNTGGDPPGTGAERGSVPRPVASRIIPCRDGYVSFGVAAAGLAFRGMMNVLRWMQEEGALGDDWEEPDLDVWAAGLAACAAEDLPAATASLGPVAERIFSFLGRRTKKELFAAAVARDFMLAPLYTIDEVAADEHLAARGYWTDVGGHRHPGPFARLSRTPICLDHPAPALGEARGTRAGRPRATAAPARGGERRPAFEGLRVADFAWVGVGPMLTKALADHGATVVHVESSARPDVLRLGPPFKDGLPGIDRSQFMANFNSSKLGLALNLSTGPGQDLARRLIGWADVVVESFTAGTFAGLGLGYPVISQDRPDLVMVSTCLRGQTGPERTYAGFGLQGSCLSGLHAITGWPDRAPAGTWGAYTDFVAPRYGLAALAAALHHRARTGEGQHIDFAQTEAAIHFLEPLLLDYFENGHVAGPAGHSSPYACPHGVFAAAGQERYVAIAVETPGQWRALCRVAPLARWDTPAFEEISARQREKPAIEDALRAWCLPQDPARLAECLVLAGVPAAVVARPSDLYRDPQLAHREFFVTLDHTVMGPTPYDGPVTRFSATPARLRKAAPCLGEDTFAVLTGLLGLSPDEVGEAAAAGALE